MRYLLIVLLGWLPLLAGAVDIDDSTRNLPLGRVMQVFEDPDGSATIAQVSAPTFARQFKPHQADVLNAGYSTSVFWLKVDLHYLAMPDAAPRTWLLELAYPPLDHLELYLPDATGQYRLVQRTGDALPYASRQIEQGNYVFELPMHPDQSLTAYLRLHSEGSVQAPLSLWSTQAYIEALPAKIYVLGLIYGVLLGMLVYNLFIYLSVRDTGYLWYILYIASFGLYQLSVNGAAVAYLWPSSPWWANAATPLFIGAAGLCGCQFARSFLQMAHHSRAFDRLLQGLVACSALVMVMALASSYGLALRLATVLALAFTLCIFAAGLFAWWRGLRVARYFTIAWSAFLLGGLVNTLMVLGHLPNTFLTMYASQIGAALEVCLLSLALADRINSMREERARVLRETGEKLALLNQQLARSNHLKDQFLATVTHELRTPMNGVIGSLELMQTMPMGAELGLYQHTASIAAQHMMRMVDDILILSELQAGRLQAQDEAFSLRGLVQELRTRFISPAMDKDLLLHLDVSDDLPDRLVGDRRKLALCLGYLLDNGIKFTQRGGVSLQVRGQASQQVLALTCTVRDSGIGFVNLDDALLYQRFFQVDGSMSREYGGLGIGLAICRKLADLLGARLSHNSVPGQGSSFELSLALAVAVPLGRGQITPG
ncbi:7TM diverse intracellular signaling domain-containing protein [Pseudomonas sp. 148P]|uniref:histidine kinase n=1 Tax=Pseudomonas ulcerans TaxID=3115852 RepID=A0ABU7HKZ0_9PSED|nr:MULTISPECIES: 7TM diverse intracellular signaling domain-containing protein [unclassified Pseudomonas]MEE1920907.1 7TM diverse intracellular signaling domain-containing protein [Pseudomonas sp. 147P]MEE1932192.1 7TM diverse intracellular signaling domain-containing protein [Pseudomonas sp. 148P]